MLFDKRECFWDDQMDSEMECPEAIEDDRVCGCGPVSCCPPTCVVEQPVQRCVKRDIVREVQHICPINTRIINNHIYRHTYVPRYTCCEQNVVTNLDQGSCCNF